MGRAEELELLARLFTDNRTNGAVVAGSAGVGKSRLAGELASRLEAEGAAVVRARATRSTATIPFGPFAEFAGDSAAQLSRLDLMRQVAEGIVARGAGRRVALFVDDAHLLDEGSAALLLHLADGRGVFVVTTLRSDEIAPDAVVVLWKEGITARLDLQPLSEKETAALIDATAGGRVRESARRRVWQLTAGNPLYIREVVAVAQSQGVLTFDGDAWAWSGSLGRHVRLAELIEEHFASLDPETRLAAETLALGEPLPGEAVAAVASAAGLDGAEQRGFAIAEPDGSVHLAHPLYGEVLAAAIPSRRARELRRRLADAMNELDAHPDAQLRVAVWRLDAGDDLSAGEALQAARRAMAMSDYRNGELLAAAAERAGAGGRAAALQGEALYWQDRADDADAVLRTVTYGTVDDETYLAAVIVHSSVLFWGLGRADAAEALLREAESLLPGPLATTALAHRCSLVLFNGRVDEAVTDAASVFATESNVLARLRAIIVLVAGCGVQGRRDAAVGGTDMAIASAIEHADELPGLVGLLLLGRCTAAMLAGEFEQADAILGSIHGLAIFERRDEFIGPIELFLGRLDLMRGRPQAATERFARAADYFVHHDPGGFTPWCFALLAQSLALTGDLDQATANMNRADLSRTPAIHIFDCEIERARAWVVWASGEHDRAARIAVDAALDAERAGVRGAAADIWHDVARLGRPREASAALSRLDSTVEGPLPRAFAAHVNALAAADAALAAEAATAFAEIGAALLAAEAHAAAAKMHASAGRRSSELACREAADAALATCNAVRTPALAYLTDAEPLAQLTAREREVVELVARGLTNQEIAETLYISVRTVGNHLNHIYAKVGLTQRSDLATLARRDRRSPSDPHA